MNLFTDTEDWSVFQTMYYGWLRLLPSVRDMTVDNTNNHLFVIRPRAMVQILVP
jgi:hypothetical protein